MFYLLADTGKVCEGSCMQQLQATFVKGIRGTDPILENGMPHIAFVGRSNVGKSTLINAVVARKELARSGKKPGKTTEINLYDIQGELFLADLPGYGFAKADPKEREKLRKLILWYLTESGARFQCVVLVIDALVGVSEFDAQMLDILRRERIPYVVAANKIDKLNQKELHAALQKIALETREGEVVPCSGEKKKGIDNLRERIFGVSI